MLWDFESRLGPKSRLASWGPWARGPRRCCLRESSAAADVEARHWRPPRSSCRGPLLLPCRNRVDEAFRASTWLDCDLGGIWRGGLGQIRVFRRVKWMFGSQVQRREKFPWKFLNFPVQFLSEGECVEWKLRIRKWGRGEVDFLLSVLSSFFSIFIFIFIFIFPFFHFLKNHKILFFIFPFSENK